MEKERRQRAVGVGVAVSILLLFAMSFFNDIVFGEIFLNNGLPHYGHVMALSPSDFSFESTFEDDEGIVNVMQVFGLNDIEVDFSTNYDNMQMALDTIYPRIFEMPNIDDLQNPNFLVSNIYTVDPRTIFLPEIFDAVGFMERDLRLTPVADANAPRVLIFHTHSTEMFIDSNPLDMWTGIVGVGAYLADLLNDMGIPTIHYARRFDIVDGQSHIMGAYERQEEYIWRILEENPSIEVIIDLHRDGLPETAPLLVTYVEGRRTARLMFVNGLSMRNVNGVPTNIYHLPNPNRDLNLAFSFQMQMALNQAHPNLTRRIYLNAFRYSTHFLPRALLVEAGDQRNTQREAKNAMYPLADALYSVLK